jgi:hypothetical protein
MTAVGRQQTLAAFSSREIPRYQLADPVLFVAIYDGSEGGGKIGKRINRIKLDEVDGSLFRRPRNVGVEHRLRMIGFRPLSKSQEAWTAIGRLEPISAATVSECWTFMGRTDYLQGNVSRTPWTMTFAWKPDGIAASSGCALRYRSAMSRVCSAVRARFSGMQ